MTNTVVGLPRSLATRELCDGMRHARALHLRGETDVPERLYLDWYLRADPADGTASDGQVDVSDVDPVAAYQMSHVDAGRFADGWTVVKLSSLGRVQVRGPQGEIRVVNRVDLLPQDRHLLPPRPGDPVRVTTRFDLLDESGFWFTFLSGWAPEHKHDHVARLYFAVDRAGSPALVHALTTELRAGGLPSAVKIGAGRHLLGRPDAAVLYVATDDVPAAAAMARRVAGTLGTHLRDRTPPLARRLGRGLALGEEPGDGEHSFGTHRCQVLAEAARNTGDYDDDALLAKARAALAEAAVDPVRPYRNAGSTLGEEL